MEPPVEIPTRGRVHRRLGMCHVSRRKPRHKRIFLMTVGIDGMDCVIAAGGGHKVKPFQREEEESDQAISRVPVLEGPVGAPPLIHRVEILGRRNGPDLFAWIPGPDTMSHQLKNAPTNGGGHGGVGWLVCRAAPDPSCPFAL